MSLTAHQLALQMAQYTGVVSLDSSDASNTGVLKPGMSPLLIPTIVACVNGALQEIHDASPTGAYYRRIGTTLNTPTAVQISLTSGSATVSVTGWQSWMNGCSVRLGGDTIVNEFTSQTTLRRPYIGTTHTTDATVYHDCIILGQDILGVKGPVEIPQIRLLDSTGSREAFYQYEWNRIYGDDYGRGLARIWATPKMAAQPRAYFTEREKTDTGSQIRLQVLPIPDMSYNLQYGVITDAISISSSDIGTMTDPNTTFGIPGGWDESVLLPMALKRFSGTPTFGNGNPLIQAEIDRQHKKARDILQQSDPNRAATKIVCNFR